jgi:hypothetical protein
MISRNQSVGEEHAVATIRQSGPRSRQLLRSQAGAFDLNSVLIGAAVIAILVAGTLVTVFGIIPWSQDHSARQDLSSVKTAEGVAKVRLGSFKVKDELLTNQLMSDANTVAVGSDAQGTCYVGISKSATGNVYFSTDKAHDPVPLTATTNTGCIDAAKRDALVGSLGGYGSAPASADGGANPAPDGTAGGTSPTGVLAANTWSAERSFTNIYPDPGFKNGISGWTGAKIYRDYYDDAATAVSYGGAGYNGDAGELVITATGSTGHQRSTAYFPIDATNVKNFSFMISTPDGKWAPTASWYASVLMTDATTGEVIGNGSTSTPTYAGGQGAGVWERITVDNWYSEPAQPHKTYLMIQATDIPIGGSVSMHVDRVFATGPECGYICAAPDSPSVPGYEPNFDGSYPASSDWTYSWTGAANASPSKAVSPKGIAAPAAASPGSTIEIKGTGYTPNTTVTPGMFFGFAFGFSPKDFNGEPVQTDGAGNFTTTMTLPADITPWSWGVGVSDDTSTFRPTTKVAVNIPMGTGASAVAAPGPWSDLVDGSTEQISAPATVTLGSDITIVGKGYAPFTRVDLYDNSWYGEATAYTDNNGYFAVTMHIPTSEESDGYSVPGPGPIYAYGDADIELNVTYQ